MLESSTFPSTVLSTLGTSGVGQNKKDEDEVSSDEDLYVIADVISSSCDLMTQPNSQAASSTSCRLVSQSVFKYDVDEAMLRAVESGRLHEWTVVEVKAIC